MESVVHTNLDLLVESYANPLLIPHDLIHLIKIYYSLAFGFNINTFLLSLDDTRIYNIWSKKKYSLSLDSDRVHHVAYNVKLPQFLQNKFTQKMMNNWSIIFNTMSLTAFHKNCFLSSTECIAYNVKLPKFPGNVTESPSLIYNKNNATLYAPNLEQRSIWTLNLDIEQELKWQRMGNGLIYSRYGASVSMVDNNRFIAILGGYTDYNMKSDKVELYGMSCNKSVKLKNMNCARNDAFSIYHNLYHRIIVGGEHCLLKGMEWYDINKDEWIMGKDTPSNLNKIQQIWISEENPNILFIAGRNKIRAKRRFATWEWGIYQMDLRTEQYQIVSIFEDIPDGYQCNFCVIHL